MVALTALMLIAAAAAPRATGSYPDTSPDAFYWQALAALDLDGVFAGTGCDRGFCPDEPIDRATMAVWAVRVLDKPDLAPVYVDSLVGCARVPTGTQRSFSDLRNSVSPGGCDEARFCPDRTVTRYRMAVFLSRAFESSEGPDPGFSDVPAGGWYSASVSKLAASGITAGCGDGTRLCPNDSTTRALMAVFLARALGLTEVPETAPPSTFIAVDGGYDHTCASAPTRASYAGDGTKSVKLNHAQVLARPS